MNHIEFDDEAIEILSVISKSIMPEGLNRNSNLRIWPN